MVDQIILWTMVAVILAGVPSMIKVNRDTRRNEHSETLRLGYNAGLAKAAAVLAIHWETARFKVAAEGLPFLLSKLHNEYHQPGAPGLELPASEPDRPKV